MKKYFALLFVIILFSGATPVRPDVVPEAQSAGKLQQEFICTIEQMDTITAKFNQVSNKIQTIKP